MFLNHSGMPDPLAVLNKGHTKSGTSDQAIDTLSKFYIEGELMWEKYYIFYSQR